VSRPKRASSPSSRLRPTPEAPADGSAKLPDQSANPAVWKYVLLALIFAGWVAMLIYCCLAGQVNQ